MTDVSYVLEREGERGYASSWVTEYAGSSKNAVLEFVKKTRGTYRLSIWISGTLIAKYGYEGYSSSPDWELSHSFLDDESDAIADLEERIQEKREAIEKMSEEAVTRKKAYDEKVAEFSKYDI